MSRGRRDPIQARTDGSDDLYGVTDWEVRSRLDRFAHWLYYSLLSLVRGFVVLAAVAILLAQFALGSLGAIQDRPLIVGMTVLSAVPALGLAAYVWYTDVTTQEPLELLVASFLLGVLFAGFAGLLNPVFGGPVRAIGSAFYLAPAAGMVFFYYLVVGPVEETVKLLAVRLYAYRDDRFDAVIDGAVYGAMAGLGFATIENAVYITQNVDTATVATSLGLVQQSADITTVRALAGPGHVIYSGIAGYYLGLAKFNPEDAGPIVVKGIVVAALIHGTYNTLAPVGSGVIALLYGVDPLTGFFLFVVVFDGLFGLFLLRKLNRYQKVYRRVHETDDPTAAPTEFE
ncbi:MAG: PrsW family intramembrane metalloprotease [Haloarculaceae archaeon]